MIIPSRLTYHGYNPYILSAGCLFAAAGRLVGYPAGQELGQPNCNGSSAPTRASCRS